MSKKISILLVFFYIAVISFNLWTTWHAWNECSWITFGISFICLVISIGSTHIYFRGALFHLGIIKGKTPVVTITLTVDNKIHKIKMMKAILQHKNATTDCEVKVNGHGEELTAIMMAMALATLSEQYGEEDLAERVNGWLLMKNQEAAGAAKKEF